MHSLAVRRASALKAVVVATLLAAILVVVFAHTVPAQAASVGGNDYPWPTASMSSLSPLRFYYRECTDYAAWEINEQMGGSTSNIKFSWPNIESSGSGNAVNWKQGAINNYGAGSVNATPAVGSVAWWGAHSWNGNLGHVAIVAQVNYNTDGSVASIVVDDYNHNFDGTYGTGTISAAAGATGNYLAWPDSFLHLADVGSSGGAQQAGTYQSFAGDFNGDGNVDIALRNTHTGMFYMRYGPTFAAQDLFQWDNSTNYQAFVGDFNGDHQVDVGLRNPQTGMFFIRYGPTFATQDTFQWDNSVASYQSFASDFNGDGHVDVALRDPISGWFYVRYGPSFTTQTAFQWDNSVSDYQAFVGDFNGDGNVDVALRNPHSGLFSVRYGPSFSTQDTFQWDNSTNYQAFVGDFNGDHQADVGLRNPNNGVFDIRYGPSLANQTAYQWDVG